MRTLFQLPLAPDVGARVLAKALLRLNGGPGSGNFGHAGRPGQIGGSSESLTFYHGTHAQAVERIKTEGLVPKGSKGADAWVVKEGKNRFGVMPVDLEMGDRGLSVYLSESPLIAEEFAEHAQNINPGSWSTILKIEIPSSALESMTEDEYAPPRMKAWKYKGVIPPEWIKGQVTDIGLEALEARGRTIYVVLLGKELKAAGGSGSGNFGHAGRPGIIGGSASAVGGVIGGSSSKNSKARALPYDDKYSDTPNRVGFVAREGAMRHAIGLVTPEGTVESKAFVSEDEINALDTTGLGAHRELFPGRLSRPGRRFRRDGNVVAWNALPAADDYFSVQDHFENDGIPIVEQIVYGGWRGSASTWIIDPRKDLAPLKALGGPGSGNFGHAGRPGSVGGSGKGGGKSSKGIFELGIIDHDGIVSSDRFEDPNDVLMGAHSGRQVTNAWARFRFVEGQVQWNDYPEAEEYFAVEDYYADKDLEVTEHVTTTGFLGKVRTQVIPRPKPPRVLGGSGSGNFGHAGRPGSVGGSASRGSGGVDKEAEAKQQQELAEAQTNPLAHPVAAIGYDGMDYRLEGPAKRYVAAYGEEFKASPRPAGIRQNKPNECYKNASLMLIERDDLTYVEGFAMKSPGGLAIFHAWNVDKDGNVIDSTLPDQENWLYFGIKYDRDAYLKHLFKAKKYGVLGSTDKNARQAIETGGRALRNLVPSLKSDAQILKEHRARKKNSTLRDDVTARLIGSEE